MIRGILSAVLLAVGVTLSAAEPRADYPVWVLIAACAIALSIIICPGKGD